jgi:hypothetical protein
MRSRASEINKIDLKVKDETYWGPGYDVNLEYGVY